LGRQASCADSVDSPPELSVIIAARLTEPALGACLAALFRQTYPAVRFEVVLVLMVGEARPAVAPIAATPYRLRVLRASGSTRGAALNLGADAATGHLCLFLGARTLADPALIAEHIQGHQEHADIIGAGSIHWCMPRDAEGFARQVGAEMRARQAGWARNPDPVSALACDCRNMSVPRAAFLAAGGFAEDLPGGLGAELAGRLQAQGYTCVYLPAAEVAQDVAKQTSVAGAAAQHTGSVAWALYQRHPALLPALGLGAFNSTSVRALLMRRLLLALHTPPRVLLALSRALGQAAWGAEWHRFVAAYCYWSGVRRVVANHDLWARLIRPPVILMYHAVGKPVERPARYRIPASRFARQMAWLHRRHYPVITLEEFARDRRAYRLPPARAVIVTFDDGYADNGALAQPILRRYGFPATIFLVSGAVGGTNQWDRDGELVGRPLLTWSDIQTLRAAGVSFGAHTRNHVPLTEVSPVEVTCEVAGSRADLEQALGSPACLFAYPHGRHDAGTQAAVAAAGFLGACCSYAGLNDPVVAQFALRRSEIRGTDSLLGFALLPWLGRARLLPRRLSWRRQCPA
jgi:peptidoglycan/xylan/chitin deacetylase (PgdA/CDA1 family)